MLTRRSIGTVIALITLAIVMSGHVAMALMR